MRSINLRKKALPGTSTEQAKFSIPVSDWISFSVTFLRVRKLAIRTEAFVNFFQSKRASKETESNSMPAKDNVVAGPHVFSGAMGMQGMSIVQGINVTDPGIMIQT